MKFSGIADVELRQRFAEVSEAPAFFSCRKVLCFHLDR